MKIKHYIFASLFLFFSSFLSATAQDTALCGDGGGGDGIKPRSPAMVITSGVSATSLQASFRLSFEKVNVTIKDEQCCVHYQSVVAVPQSNKVAIDISMLPAGVYTIEYADRNRSVVGADKFTIR